MKIGHFFGITSVLTLAALLAGGALAQTPEQVYRFRLAVHADDAVVMAASWIGVEGRTSKIAQRYETPYQRDIALGPDGEDVEGVLNGTIEISVRPFRYRGELCLDVDLHSHTAGDLHHYRSVSVLEVLPATDSYSVSGSFCDSEAQEDGGLLFNLDVGRAQDGSGTMIIVTPDIPIQRGD